jgi:hypothetical protein
MDLIGNSLQIDVCKRICEMLLKNIKIINGSLFGRKTKLEVPMNG